jgi:hypothetical protein
MQSVVTSAIISRAQLFLEKMTLHQAAHLRRNGCILAGTTQLRLKSERRWRSLNSMMNPFPLFPSLAPVNLFAVQEVPHISRDLSPLSLLEGDEGRFAIVTRECKVDRCDPESGNLSKRQRARVNAFVWPSVRKLAAFWCCVICADLLDSDWAGESAEDEPDTRLRIPLVRPESGESAKSRATKALASDGKVNTGNVCHT